MKMAAKLNENELRKELIVVYQKFIDNPNDRENRERMSELDRIYSAAHNLIYDDDIKVALNNVSFLWQRELPDQEDHSVDPVKILRRLKGEK